MEWVIGRLFLDVSSYGSVYSLNYDGLLTNDPEKGVDDYAREKVSLKIKQIKALTKSDSVILIGHSMGGLIAGFYAEHVAQKDGVNVEHVVSIATPWQGTPIVDFFWKLGGCWSRDRESKRHLQMSVFGSTKTEPLFRQNLVNQVLASEQQKTRNYYSIWSTTDYVVPRQSGNLSVDPTHCRMFTYLGHYAVVVWPPVWMQIRRWLDAAYAKAG